MAKWNYLVDGLSGTGKSSVFDELVRRGYKAVSTDRAWSYHGDPDTGLPIATPRYDTWIWDRQKAVGELEDKESEPLFVCGSGRNADQFLHYFTAVFNLHLDNETLRRRLEERLVSDRDELPPSNERNWTPMQPEEVEHTLELNRRGEKLPGAVDIDATQSLSQVVDELLRLANSLQVEGSQTEL